MARGDIRLEIIYNMGDPNETIIKTNAKEKVVSEILTEWALSQMGQGEDKGEARKDDSYKITIELDLNCDIFRTISDTGNEGLTAGIIMDVIERLKKIKIVDL